MRMKINIINSYPNRTLSKLQMFNNVHKKGFYSIMVTLFSAETTYLVSTWFLLQNMGDHRILFIIGPSIYVTSMPLSHPCFVIFAHCHFHLWWPRVKWSGTTTWLMKDFLKRWSWSLLTTQIWYLVKLTIPGYTILYLFITMYHLDVLLVPLAFSASWTLKSISFHQ